MKQAHFSGTRLRLKRLFFFFVLLMILCCSTGLFPTGAAQRGANWSIEGVLGMMDKSARDFHSLTADIEHVKYTAVVKDTSTETGQIFVRKDEKLRIDFQKPDPRTILRNGDNLYIYTPKIGTVEEFNIGKNRAMADQYLALG